ncbi:MAG TPA: DUF3108 domain-containing protein [Burkholderiales bacterium]
MRHRWLVLAALAPTALCAAPPHHVVVEYDMSRNDMVMAQLKETLDHDGKSYRIVSEGKATGIFAVLAPGTVLRTSEGAVAAEGLLPREYREQRGSKSASARFDRSAHTLVQQREGQAAETQPLPERAQDRLAYLWSFAFVPPKSGHVEAMVADGRGAPVRYDYAVAGGETLKTPMGDLQTLHLVKQRTPDDSRQTEVWLDEKRNFVPVRVLVVEKDGTRLDQVVTRIEE